MGGQGGRSIHLTRYPVGMPTPGDFDIRESETPAPGEGEMLCRTIWMSVDPYMRGRMRPDIKSYIPPFALDKPLEGGAVSEVIESNIDGFEPGDYVVDFTGGWKEYYVSKDERTQKVDP